MAVGLTVDLTVDWQWMMVVEGQTEEAWDDRGVARITANHNWR